MRFALLNTGTSVIALILVALWLVSGSTSAFAEEHAGAAAPVALGEAHSDESGGDAEHGGSEHGEGHEELKLLHIDEGGPLWSIVIFVVLLIVLRVFAWKPLISALDEREKKINQGIQDADAAKKALDNADSEFKSRMLKATHEAHEIIEEAKRDQNVVLRHREEEFEKELVSKNSQAQREIGLAKSKAMEELLLQTVNLSTEIASKILRERITPESHQTLIQREIDEFKKKYAV
ncbi:MAG: F0F1 ATP synthase subunit B [Planctomycetes bacterium]|nr:F0F1 ATP synthase subunit B [Planctomycetota bacterium]